MARLLAVFLLASLSGTSAFGAIVLTVRVVDEPGRPVVDRQFILYRPDPYLLSSSSATDSAGNVRLESSEPAGTYICLKVIAPPGRTYTVSGSNEFPGNANQDDPRCGNFAGGNTFFYWEHFPTAGGYLAIKGGASGYVNLQAGDFAEILLSPQREGQIKVRVLTPQGALVWESGTQVVAATSYVLLQRSVRWDGSDAAGRKVASGIYLVHAQGGGIDEIKRIAVVRK